MFISKWLQHFLSSWALYLHWSWQKFLLIFSQQWIKWLENRHPKTSKNFQTYLLFNLQFLKIFQHEIFHIPKCKIIAMRKKEWTICNLCGSSRFRNFNSEFISILVLLCVIRISNKCEAHIIQYKLSYYILKIKEKVTVTQGKEMNIFDDNYMEINGYCSES